MNIVVIYIYIYIYIYIMYVMIMEVILRVIKSRRPPLFYLVCPRLLCSLASLIRGPRLLLADAPPPVGVAGTSDYTYIYIERERERERYR